MKKKILFASSSRADFGLLKPLILKFQSSEKYITKTIATGSHLLHSKGATVDEMKEIDIEPIDIVSDEGLEDTLSIMSYCLKVFPKVIQDFSPDLIFLLGDRFEIFSFAQCALLLNIPIAHIHGGESTIGAIDDVFRHSITKMSLLHFSTNEIYKRRIIQLGESPERVFNVGSLGVENVLHQKLMSKHELNQISKFKFSKFNALVTFHPETRLPKKNSLENLKNLLESIKALPEVNFLVTGTNIDPNYQEFDKLISKYINNKHIFYHESLGMKNFISMLKHCDLIIGNSSSGIIEAPSCSTFTINIGDRQTGREMGKSIINTEPIKRDIIQNINICLDKQCNALNFLPSLYGDGQTSNRIYEIISSYDFNQQKLKQFYDLK